MIRRLGTRIFGKEVEEYSGHVASGLFSFIDTIVFSPAGDHRRPSPSSTMAPPRTARPRWIRRRPRRTFPGRNPHEQNNRNARGWDSGGVARLGRCAWIVLETMNSGRWYRGVGMVCDLWSFVLVAGVWYDGGAEGEKGSKNAYSFS